MKRIMCSILMCVFLVALSTGCAKIGRAKVNFMTPGNDGIAFAPGSKIKIVSNGNEEVGRAIRIILIREFQAVAEKNVQNAIALAQSQGKDAQKAKAKAESEQIQISDVNPDYWLFISINNDYRKDDANVAEYNRRTYKTKDENQSGGREVIRLTGPLTTASSAAVVTMTLYSVHGLVPVHSFDIAIYDSEISKDSLKDEKQYLKQFAMESVKRIMDGFLTMEREMTVLLPRTADKRLIAALKTKDSNKLQEIATSLNLTALDQFLEEINALEEQHKPKLFNNGKMVRKMANHYVYAIDFESKNLDTRSLRLAQRCYLAMLKHTQDKFLAEACANSLARVERKLELLESVKQ